MSLSTNPTDKNEKTENNYSLYNYEQAQIEKLFDCKNYLFRNSRHEKTVLENSSGAKLVRHVMFKPADIAVYKKLATISCPNLCRILEVSEYDEGYVIYEEYCDGMNIAEVMGSRDMSEYEAVETACRICVGLDALHSCGIIHRDIKPDNIIICNDNNVKIIDFDIAKIYKSNKTTDTSTLGTIGFAAPEQYGFSQSDVRSDLYSLSVLLNYMLTREHPSVKLCENKHLSKLLTKCLSINPTDRYSSAKELYIALKKAQRRLKK